MLRVIESSASPVLEALANGILQGMLLVLLVWVIIGLARWLNATTRYTIWLTALIAIVGLPVLAPHVAQIGTDGYRLLSPPPEYASRTTDVPHAAVGIGNTAAPVASPHPATAFPVYERSPWDKGTTMVTGALERAGLSLPITVNPGWGTLLVFSAILFGSILLFARLVWSACQLRRLKSSALPLPSPLRERIDELLKGHRTFRRIRVRHVDGLTMPTACGFVHPVIVFPSHLLGKLTASEVEHIVRHELAHLRRWDDWTNLLQRMVEAVFFFHPAVRIVGRQLSLQREIACDDWVISQSNGVRSYAICLTRLVSLTSWSPRQPLAALGALRTKSQFTLRIEALLNRKRNALPQLSKAALVSVMVLLTLTIGQLGQMPALLAFEETIDTSQPELLYASLPPALAPEFQESDERVHVERPGIAPPRVGHVRFAPVSVTRTYAPQVRVIPVVAELTAPKVEGRVTWTRLTSTASFSVPQIASRGRGKSALADQQHVSLDELTGLLGVGVNGEYIRKLRQLGITDVSVDELFELRGNGVTLEYLSALRKATFRHLSIDTIRELRLSGVDAAYIRAITQTGLESLSIDELITLRSAGVTPGFVKAARYHGPQDLTVDEIAYLRHYGVSGDYLRAMKATGFTPLSAEDIVALRLNSVSADFVSALQNYNPVNLTRDGILALHSSGVSSRYVENLREAGIDELHPQELLDLRLGGVSSAYRDNLRSLGRIWSVEDIVKLSTNGVTSDFINEAVNEGLETITVDGLIRRRARRVSGATLQ